MRGKSAKPKTTPKICYPSNTRVDNVKEEVKRAWFLLKILFSYKIIKILLILALFFITVPFGFFLAFRPTVQKDINYGITFSPKYATELGLDWRDTYIKILDDLGIENLRLVAYWDDVEPINGEYDFSTIKWQLDEAQKRGVNVILVMGRKSLRWPECFEPDWWKNMQSETEQQAELLEYIGKTTEALKSYDNIFMWQVENEPFFPFGVCAEIKKENIEEEVAVVRSIDPRPILIQDSGEGGFWYPSYKMGDYLAISMYRKIWYDFWGAFLGRFIYFQYPLAHWTYKIKAAIFGVPYQKIYVTELQAEPWGPGINSSLSEEEKAKSMSRNDFLSTISYAQKAGFKNLYFWGAEWWLWEKERNNNPFYWDTVKALIRD